MSTFSLTQVTSQKGRIAIVTGANIGLGYETSLVLARKAMKVILACRNLSKAEAAKAKIIQEVPNADLEIIQLDLSKLSSVREFAAKVLAKFDRLDLLINNAGIMIPPLSKTEDGFESQMGVNYFSHFLLTGLLLPLIEKTDHSRIVTLSSIAHKNGVIDFDNLNAEKSYSKIDAYGQSKLACLMFTYELHRRLTASGSQVLSVAAHPGVSMTNLGQHMPAFLQLISPLIAPLFTHSPKNAALPSLYAALGKDIVGGDYTGPSGFREMKGPPAKATSTRASHDEQVAAKLWEVSEKLTGFSYLSK